MIDIKVIGSGSSGNCYLANINGTKLLLECGLSFKTIQKALDYKISEIEACLITHEHGDHSKAVKDMMKAGVDCYMTNGTANYFAINWHRLNRFSCIGASENEKRYASVRIGNLLIKPFEAVHDVNEPVSFYVRDVITQESLLFVTDTAYIKYKIPDVDILMIECNYVKSVIDKKVEAGKLNPSLRNRIVKNHMSLETLLEALKEADLSRLKKIYILHLSDSNSDERLILESVERATGIEVCVC